MSFLTTLVSVYKGIDDLKPKNYVFKYFPLIISLYFDFDFNFYFQFDFKFGLDFDLNFDFDFPIGPISLK